MLTDMDRLIEAVARAMCESMGIDPDGLDRMVICDKENNPLPLWQYYDDVAAAAILATLRGIREPTLEMCNAGIPINCTGLPTGDWREGICAAPNCSCYEKHGMRIVPATYRAMIDRLIQEFAPEGKGEG